MQTQTKCYIEIDVFKRIRPLLVHDKRATVLKALRRLQQKAQGDQLWLTCEAAFGEGAQDIEAAYKNAGR